MPADLKGPHLRKLKSLAQRLEPILRVGKAGVSEPFLKSVDDALALHELIKIKFADFKEEKKELSSVIAQKTSSAIIMRVGHVLVLYRQQPDPARRKIPL